MRTAGGEGRRRLVIDVERAAAATGDGGGHDGAVNRERHVAGTESMGAGNNLHADGSVGWNAVGAWSRSRIGKAGGHGLYRRGGNRQGIELKILSVAGGFRAVGPDERHLGDRTG